MSGTPMVQARRRCRLATAARGRVAALVGAGCVLLGLPFAGATSAAAGAATVTEAGPSPLTLDGWVSQGGSTTSHPGVAVEGDDADLFVRGLDGGVWTRTVGPDAGADAWRALGGATTDGVAAIAQASGTELYVRGLDGALWYVTCSRGAGCGTWASLGGQLRGAPAVASGDPARTDVFVRGLDDQLWQLTRTATGWGPWHAVGGVLTSGPATTATASRTSVAVRGADGAAWHRTSTDGIWGGWGRIDGPIEDQPGLLTDEDGNLHVLVRGPAGDLWTAAAPVDGAFGSYSQLPGALLAGPAVTILPITSRRVPIVAVRGADGATWVSTATFHPGPA